jgi:hypothetical protein
VLPVLTLAAVVETDDGLEVSLPKFSTLVAAPAEAAPAKEADLTAKNHAGGRPSEQSKVASKHSQPILHMLARSEDAAPITPSGAPPPAERPHVGLTPITAARPKRMHEDTNTRGKRGECSQCLSLPSHCPLIALSLPSHCSVTALSLPSHCPLIALSLPCHCPLTALSRPSHCPLTALSLPSHCPLSALSPPYHGTESLPKFHVTHVRTRCPGKEARGWTAQAGGRGGCRSQPALVRHARDGIECQGITAIPISDK